MKTFEKKKYKINARVRKKDAQRDFLKFIDKH